MDLNKEWEYQFREWKKVIGFEPIEHIKSEDFSEPYEIDIGHVFKLVEDKGALVLEQGCSCYDAGDASIDIYPDVECALDALERWAKDKKHDGIW